MPLRPNSSCSTIINFTLTKSHQNYEKSLIETEEQRERERERERERNVQHPGTNKKSRPVLQRGITIIEQVPLNGNAAAATAGYDNTNAGGSSISIHSNANNSSYAAKLPVKYKFYQLLFKSSKNFSCAAAAAAAAAQSCAQGSSDAEPTEV